MTLVVSAIRKCGLKWEGLSLGTGPNVLVFFFAGGEIGMEMTSSSGEPGGDRCRAGLGGVGSSSWSGGGRSTSKGSS